MRVSNERIDRHPPNHRLGNVTGYRQLKEGEIILEGDTVDGGEVSKWQIGGTVTRDGVERPGVDWEFGTPKKILTHGGKHHTDELMAAHILMELFPGSELVRQEGFVAGFDFTLDTGRKYHPESGAFDHHKGTPGVPFCPPWRCIGYSTCGLVWDYFGEAYIRQYLDNSERWASILASLSEEDYHNLVGQLWERLDYEMICPVDRWDLGTSPIPKGVLPAQRLIQFMDPLVAVEALGGMFRSRMHALTSYTLGGREILRSTQTESGERKVYVLGNSVVVVGSRRVETAAARSFMDLTGEGLQLLAVISPLNSRNRWVILLEEPVKADMRVWGLEALNDNRTYFGDSPAHLLDFARWVAGATLETSDLCSAP